MPIAGATSAGACALLVALPMSIEDVRHDLQLPDRFDYAKAMQGLAGTLSAEAIWSAHFAPVAAAWQDCRQRLRAQGITVIESASSNCLRDVLEGDFRSVTVLGHWKGHEVLPADLIADPFDIAAELLSEKKSLGKTLRPLLEISDLSRLTELASIDEYTARIELAEILTRVVEGEQPLFGLELNDGESFAVTPAELHELNRRQLDYWLPGRIVTGNRLELRDGLHSAGELAPLISDNFVGSLQLCNCHSTLLQRSLGAPHRRILGNEEVLLPRLFLEIYEMVVNLLAESGLTYPELWLEVLASLQYAQLEKNADQPSSARKFLTYLRRSLFGHGEKQ